jgi:hypothetical protein
MITLPQSFQLKTLWGIWSTFQNLRGPIDSWSVWKNKAFSAATRLVKRGFTLIE